MPRSALHGGRDRDDGAGSSHALPLDPAECVDDGAPLAELPIGDLQRETRVHVVDIRDAKERPGQLREQRAFLVRVQKVVAAQAQPAEQVEEQQEVEPDLQPRRARLDRPRKMRPAGTKHPRLQVRRLLTDSVGQDVDLVAAGHQLPGAMIGAERRAAGGVEGLWNDLQYAHASHIPVRDQPRAIDHEELAKARREQEFELHATRVAARLLQIRGGRPRVAAQLDRPRWIDQRR